MNRNKKKLNYIRFKNSCQGKNFIRIYVDESGENFGLDVDGIAVVAFANKRREVKTAIISTGRNVVQSVLISSVFSVIDGTRDSGKVKEDIDLCFEQGIKISEFANIIHKDSLDYRVCVNVETLDSDTIETVIERINDGFLPKQFYVKITEHQRSELLSGLD